MASRTFIAVPELRHPSVAFTHVAHRYIHAPGVTGGDVPLAKVRPTTCQFSIRVSSITHDRSDIIHRKIFLASGW